MDKKKIIWIGGALALAGLVSYKFFHKCYGECFYCRYPSSNLIDVVCLGGGILLGLYLKPCLLN